MIIFCFIGSKGIQYLVTKNITDDCEGIRCGRGRCIDLAHVCDGVRDCEDSNDESEIACEKKKDMCKDPYHSGCGKLYFCKILLSRCFR